MYFHTHDREVPHKALTYFGVIGLFAVGAGFGALLTVSFLIMFIREEKAK